MKRIISDSNHDMKISQLYTQFTLLKELFLGLAEKKFHASRNRIPVCRRKPLSVPDLLGLLPLRMGAELPKKQESHTCGI